MADDNLTELSPDTKVTPAEETGTKVTRAPRRKAASADTAAKVAPSAVKQPGTRRKKVDTAPGADAATKATTELAARAALTHRSRRNSVAAEPNAAVGEAPAAVDEIADLLQLEAENARLRKLLSDKLRQENSDLRKKLGIV